ncbi:penicillin-binding protein 2 [Odoribacter lunatus]|uniref:penicillin-binding protein 2 n=1 Tax=Odoribacter lunatus TaxID=2941335 RepID=UPI0020400C3F|nr:penicillin-binding protein 2 [Odoribacter lunatus]
MNKFTHRKAVVSGLMIFVFVIYILQLFNLQVLDGSYKLLAINNSQRIETQFPARGLIYDRHNKLLVYNQAAYDLMVIPRQIKAFDTTELTSILGITPEFLKRNLDKCKKYSRYKASVLVSQITDSKYARLQEKLYKYSGFFIQTRTLRKYNVAHSADVFGYVGEVSQSQIDKDSTYTAGDYIGINGLEKSYENILRGKKGEKILLVDNHNRVMGSYKNGEHDIPAVVGGNLTTTLDIELQEYAYQLMQNKKGGIIAIEPATGEILLKVSSPGYDPQLLVGLERGENYRTLQQNPHLPLFDRTVTATYPPGSIFKTIQGLIGLQEKVITPATMYECHYGNSFNGQFMKCHGHDSPLDLKGGIQNSCNPYFVNVFRKVLENNKYSNVREAYGKWRDYVLEFGLGQCICPDFMNESSGSIPTQEYYDKVLRTQNWFYTYIMSLSIGQGELLITPLQMANIVTCIANRGYYITPHIVRPTDEKHKEQIQRHNLSISKAHFDIIADAMEEAVKKGTARIAACDSISVCGKTGTIQNPSGLDHSAFFAFAPKENPRIAILVYVENGKWGASYGAPIAGLLIEKYLKGKISPRKKGLEKRMLESNLITPQPPEKQQPQESEI